MTVPSPSLTTSPCADQWLRFAAARFFELRPEKVELGQGISAALTQIACDALGVQPNQVLWVTGDTSVSPDEGFTARSQSIEVGSHAWQRDGDIVQSHFAQIAAQYLNCKASKLRLKAGSFTYLLAPHPVTTNWRKKTDRLDIIARATYRLTPSV